MMRFRRLDHLPRSIVVAMSAAAGAEAFTVMLVLFAVFLKRVHATAPDALLGVCIASSGMAGFLSIYFGTMLTLLRTDAAVPDAWRAIARVIVGGACLMASAATHTSFLLHALGGAPPSLLTALGTWLGHVPTSLGALAPAALIAAIRARRRCGGPLAEGSALRLQALEDVDHRR
jgi:hypothetical protein